jgi:membrane-associated phospholipid phosphatase
MSGTARSKTHEDAVRAAGILVLADAVYSALRKLVEGTPEAAAHNARRLLSLEHVLGIDVERSVQRFVMEHPLLVDWSNHTYVWLYFPFLISAFIVVFARDRRAYRHLRNAIVTSGAVGLVIFAVFPVAPPRFMPGFVGTLSEGERQHFVQHPASWSNRMAALPSFHAGWTLVAAIVLAATMRSRAGKVLALLPAPLIAFAVIATGNHYVLDIVAGSALALGALVFARLLSADRSANARQGPKPAVSHSSVKEQAVDADYLTP